MRRKCLFVRDAGKSSQQEKGWLLMISPDGDCFIEEDTGHIVSIKIQFVQLKKWEG